jgi:preprotein translocase subunit SecE
MEKIRAFFSGYADELVQKVHWPSIPELQASTVTVLIASLIIAVVIGLMDLVFRNVLDFLYQVT